MREGDTGLSVKDATKYHQVRCAENVWKEKQEQELPV